MKEWLQSPRDHRSILNLKRSQENLFAKQLLWQVSADYYSTLNPVFLHQLTDLSLLSYSKVWLIRDGLIPVLSFFVRYPEPPVSWKTRLLLQSRLAEYVPPPWREFIGTYEIRKAAESIEAPRQLLFASIISNLYCSLTALKEKLETIRSLQAQLGGAPILAFLDSRYSYLSPLFHIEYMQLLRENLGTSMKLIAWGDFLRIDDFNGMEVVDLNDFNLCSDSYLVHHALSNGANCQDLSVSKAGNNGAFYEPLSHYHGFDVCLRMPQVSWNEKIFDEIRKRVRVEDLAWVPEFKNGDSMPWSKAIVEWALSKSSGL